MANYLSGYSVCRFTIVHTPACRQPQERIKPKFLGKARQPMGLRVAESNLYRIYPIGNPPPRTGAQKVSNLSPQMFYFDLLRVVLNA